MDMNCDSPISLESARAWRTYHDRKWIGRGQSPGSRTIRRPCGCRFGRDGIRDERAHWDIKCRTDEELADCVKTIRDGTAEYDRRAALEWEYMDDHREVAKGVFRTTYANGAKTYVNYNALPVSVDGRSVPALGSVVVDR